MTSDPRHEVSRARQLEAMRNGSFDILIVGGGATGTGIALDAASRGLKVALLERADFSSGTSSRSTKLIHGGVRYLEQAVKGLDVKQLNLVRDALKERRVLLEIAPHLSRPLPLLTPLYNLIGVPYYLTGLKMYDILAGGANLAPSRYLGARKARERFPMLRQEGLRGGVLYYDGQFDDARMNVTLALTAIAEGAAVANYASVTELLKEDGRVRGAVVRDELSGETFEVPARVVINATGPFADGVRLMDDPQATPMLSASSGAHVVLDKRFSPPDTGLLIPKTEDGRVLFLLPWQGHTLVGTTDAPAAITANPQASEDEIEYILRHVRRYFDLPVEREDVLSAWSGLRPLVSDPRASDTARLSRDHVINTSESGLLTIAGGKWTTYRKMALDAVDHAVKVGRLEPRQASQTERLKLLGARNGSAGGELAGAGLEKDIEQHLLQAYGDRAGLVAGLAAAGHGERLVAGYPYIEAEVIYAARYEMAVKPDDVLEHRTRLSFLNRSGSEAARDRVGELLEGAQRA